MPDSIEQIIEVIALAHGYEPEDLKGLSQVGGLPNARRNVVRAAVAAGYDRHEIAAGLNRSPSSVYDVMSKLGLLARRGRGLGGGSRGRAGAALGPDSVAYEHGDDLLSRMRRARARLERIGRRDTDIYRRLCARIVDIETGPGDEPTIAVSDTAAVRDPHLASSTRNPRY